MGHAARLHQAFEGDKQIQVNPVELSSVHDA